MVARGGKVIARKKKKKRIRRIEIFINSDLYSRKYIIQLRDRTYHLTRSSVNPEFRMAKSNTSDAQALIRSLRSAYAATPTNLKIIDLYVVYAITTAVIQVVYMGIVGSFPFNSFLWRAVLCRDSSTCRLPPYSSQQREQGV
ncbi:dolichyl-diphosphooligosaccharide--protein glycosyltransferase subunit DAD1 isoform X1 [Canna indica]|uniref:Dolichyl-diphosphooligosaccharide--protein glycosyltransferase subunit DAD1 n=1 Tax=Canna indica TaxID=4628 RepID=A0AAQ3L799_9LILI|nr:dolichyl-diphosphooligosaccharide--protein glycosyltransferase subunit DAD1 isoform X1 [Canna indica]